MEKVIPGWFAGIPESVCGYKSELYNIYWILMIFNFVGLISVNMFFVSMHDFPCSIWSFPLRHASRNKKCRWWNVDVAFFATNPNPILRTESLNGVDLAFASPFYTIDRSSLGRKRNLNKNSQNRKSPFSSVDILHQSKSTCHKMNLFILFSPNSYLSDGGIFPFSIGTCSSQNRIRQVHETIYFVSANCFFAKTKEKCSQQIIQPNCRRTMQKYRNKDKCIRDACRCLRWCSPTNVHVTTISSPVG